MINHYGKPYTKKDILDIAQDNGRFGGFINTDGIRYDLDGEGMAEYLTSLGFTVTSYKDMGRYGLVKTLEGLRMSTNGYTRMEELK